MEQNSHRKGVEENHHCSVGLAPLDTVYNKELQAFHSKKKCILFSSNTIQEKTKLQKYNQKNHLFSANVENKDSKKTSNLQEEIEENSQPSIQ